MLCEAENCGALELISETAATAELEPFSKIGNPDRQFYGAVPHWQIFKSGVTHDYSPLRRDLESRKRD
jgi:hypothetical protein